jgi:Xaa-Pro aminopeptidase
MRKESFKGLRDYLPQLPLCERDRRWALVREYMANERLDALVLFGSDIFYGYGTANVRYLTHVGSTQGSLCIFPLEGEPVVFAGPSHMSIPFNYFSKTQDWVTDLRPVSGIGGLVSELKAKGLERGSLGIVGFASQLVANTIPHGLYTQLVEDLPRARLRDVTRAISHFRLIKSPAEIELLSRAGDLARKTVMRAWETARPGVTEAEVFADMMHCQIVNGGEPHSFILMASGPADDSGEWHLLHPEAVPGAPTMRALQHGDLLITEFHANYGGYLAACEFSMYLGRPPKELQRIHDVSVECYQRYPEAMKAGNTLREVLEAVRKPCLDAGLDYIELGFHGHGLVSPEFPTIVYKPGQGSLGGQGIGDLVLRENMVFGTNIDIHDPAWSTSVGHMLGDMIQVTSTGGKLLTRTPTHLFGKTA